MNKPKILLIVDYPNWAYYYKAKNIVKNLSSKYNFKMTFVEEDPKPEDPKDYDGIYKFYWWLQQCKEWNIPRNKFGSGITSNRDYLIMNKEKIKEKLSKFKVFTANSILLLNEFKKYRKDIIYTPNGVNVDFFKPIKYKKNKEFTIGWVGDINTKMKHFHDIIVPAVEKCKNVKLITATKENYISREKMPKFYNKCDCLIVASEMDGTPNPALEAAACGKPIISNHIGNMPELIKDNKNGFLINLDIKEYIKKICFLRDNRNVCEEMGKRIRKDIEKDWSWKKLAWNYDKVFKKLVG